MNKQIRNLAISGVDTLEKANKVCEIVGDTECLDTMNYKEWFFDDGNDAGFMYDWDGQSNDTNFEFCTQMTYEEFLEKYDSPKDDLVSDDNRAIEIIIDSMAKSEKAEYEKNPGKWVVYTKLQGHEQFLKGCGIKYSWLPENEYKLILKEHEEIADAVIANPDVEVEVCVVNGTWLKLPYPNSKGFFESYDKNKLYRLAKPQCDGKAQLKKLPNYTPPFVDASVPQRFNGGYIKASLDAWHLLNDDVEIDVYHIAPERNGYYYIEQGKAHWYRNDEFGHLVNFKQFYINNKALSWDEPTSANSAQVQTNDMEGLNELPTVGEEDCSPEPDGIKAEFAKYGFEVPDFECELIAIDDDGQIVGFTYPNGSKTLTYFNIQGQAFEIDEKLLRWKNKDLTPIKAKWYEELIACKGFEIPVVDSGNCMFIASFLEDGMFQDANGNEIGLAKNLREATKEEVYNLFQDKE